MKALSRLMLLIASCLPTVAAADVIYHDASGTNVKVGASGLWILSNICFAGMRAQNSPSAGWRIVSFIFGFPGTLVTYFVVTEGSERAYGD